MAVEEFVLNVGPAQQSVVGPRCGVGMAYVGGKQHTVLEVLKHLGARLRERVARTARRGFVGIDKQPLYQIIARSIRSQTVDGVVGVSHVDSAVAVVGNHHYARLPVAHVGVADVVADFLHSLGCFCRAFNGDASDADTHFAQARASGVAAVLKEAVHVVGVETAALACDVGRLPSEQRRVAEVACRRGDAAVVKHRASEQQQVAEFVVAVFVG